MAAGADPGACELARAAQAGSREAFASLVARHEAGLFRFLRLRTGRADLAEELLQDTFVRCWRKLDRFDPARPFSSWLYRVAANLAAGRLRRRREPAALPIADLPGGEDPAAVAAAEEEGTNVWDLVQRHLPAELASALWLFHVEGCSAAAVGEILGRSEGAVRTALCRARARLAALLGAATSDGAPRRDVPLEVR